MTTLLSLLFWLSLVAMIWTFFAYPLFMLVWSKLAPQPVKKDTNFLPTLTLLIPAYNESDVIRGKLQNSINLAYPKEKLEVLLVDDGSTDGTAEIAESISGVKVLRQSQRGGKMSGVNRGFAEASGEIVVLSDASPHYEAESLRQLMAPFADPKVGVVVGTLAVWDAENAVAKSAGMYWKYEAALRKWESRTGSTVAVHGNMFAIRRALFRPLPKGTVNDEFSMAMDALQQGYRVVYEPSAISYDMASTTMGDEYKRRARINAGRYQSLFSAGYLKAPTFDLAFRLFSHKLLRPLAPIFMLLMVITNVWLALTDGYWLWWVLLIGQIIFYGLALLGMLAEQRGIKIKFLNIPYFFVSSNMAALSGLWRWLTKQQRVTWEMRKASLDASHKGDKVS